MVEKTGQAGESARESWGFNMERETNEQRLLKVLIRRADKGVNSIEAMRYAGSRAAARKNELRKKGWTILGFDEKWMGIQSKRWIIADFINKRI